MSMKKRKKRPNLISMQLVGMEAEIDAIYARKAALIQKTVAKCKHPIQWVHELKYTDSGDGRPWLICTDCGYTEEGWGCGYYKLKHADTHKQARISFEDWLEIRTVVMSQNALSEVRFAVKKS